MTDYSPILCTAMILILPLVATSFVNMSVANELCCSDDGKKAQSNYISAYLTIRSVSVCTFRNSNDHARKVFNQGNRAVLFLNCFVYSSCISKVERFYVSFIFPTNF